jgi:hypothetical protein
MIPLCPKSIPGFSVSDESLQSYSIAGHVSAHSQARLTRRQDETAIINESSAFLQALQARWPLLEQSGVRRVSLFDQPSPPSLAPLDQCIQMIFWEALDADCHYSGHIIGTHEGLQLLHAAALYQSKTDTVGFSCI